MSSIDGFQIFQNRRPENNENRPQQATPNRVTIPSVDASRLAHFDRPEFNESSCGSGSAHMELTQQESEEWTQQSSNNSAVKKKPPSQPEPKAWGMLKRQGGLQEEFELHHRVADFKRDTYSIGRSSKCDITVADTWVSTTHCLVYCDYTQPKLRMFIEDCSANGTYINDSLTRLRKNERMELKSGDQIYLLNPRKPENLKKTFASFVYINMRERLVAFREISYAPNFLSDVNTPPMTVDCGASSSNLTNNTNTNTSSATSTTANTHTNTATRTATVYAPHIEDTYIIGDQIGSGMSGQVYFCVHKLTHQQYAVKMIETKKFSLNPGLSVADLREEAILMREFDHPNIIKVVDSFQSDTMIYIVMELLKGGDLFDRIIERERYNEDSARRLMQQVLSAVQYLHTRNIIHRDLKPENILLVSSKNDVDVKVTDFGLAKKANREGLKTFCGTPQYFAPEVLKRKHQDKSSVAQLSRYGKAVDMWSLGVVLYILLSGSFPFGDDEEILRAQYSLSGVEWDGVSPGAKHLIRCLMTLDVNHRFTVEQALKHPWISGIEYAPATHTTAVGASTAGATKKKSAGPATNLATTANTTTNNTDTANPVLAPPVPVKRTNTNANTNNNPTTNMRRANSNLHRVNSVFAPLELKQRSSMVYATTSSSVGAASGGSAASGGNGGSSASVSMNIGSGVGNSVGAGTGLSGGIASILYNTTTNTTSTTNTNTNTNMLPPASEVFTVFGKAASPVPKTINTSTHTNNAVSNDKTTTTSATAGASGAANAKKKARVVVKGKTTDEISTTPSGKVASANTSTKTSTNNITTPTNTSTNVVTSSNNTVVRNLTNSPTNKVLALSRIPTHYVDLSHTMYSSTIQVPTTNSGIVHLTVCNDVSCLDAYRVSTIDSISTSTTPSSHSNTTHDATSASKQDLKRSRSYTNSTIFTSPNARASTTDTINTTTSGTTTPNTSTIKTHSGITDRGDKTVDKVPGFNITSGIKTNIDPYDDVIEDYSDDEWGNVASVAVSGGSGSGSGKRRNKRAKTDTSITDSRGSATKPPLGSGSKSRNKNTANTNTSSPGTSPTANTNNSTSNGAGINGRKRSVSFSDHLLVHDVTSPTNNSVVSTKGGSGSGSASAGVAIHVVVPQVTPTETTTSTTTTTTSNCSAPTAKMFTFATFTNATSAAVSGRAVGGDVALVTPTAVLDTTTVGSTSDTSINTGINTTATTANASAGGRGIKRMQSSLEQAWKIKVSKTHDLITTTADHTSTTTTTAVSENAIAANTTTTNISHDETGVTMPVIKKLRVPMKSLTELFRAGTTNK